jgi:hypothetical protein
MKKKFNITGTCLPGHHYMMDASAKQEEALRMIERGEYFTINRPRQYGKTTTLFALSETLNQSGRYRCFSMSFEGVGDEVFEGEASFCEMFLQQLARYASLWRQDLGQWLLEQVPARPKLKNLSQVVEQFVLKCGLPVVLLIDEVDKSSNNQLFLSFLGMLRTKYLERTLFPTFHSVVLAGLHDVKTLKLKLRPEEAAKYNSPWNIASDFEVEMSFQPHEIAPMLLEYSQAEGVEIDIPPFAEKLYYYTSGHPFLVSKLCKTIAEKILPLKTERTWAMDDLEQSVQLLLRENNTNFDSLIKHMENSPELYDLAYRIIIEGEYISFNPHEPTISLGRLYGVFKENGSLKIHNRIYEQLLYAYMSVKAEVGAVRLPSYGEHFQTPQGLDLEALLARFQQFMRSEHSNKDADFLERNGRLVFLAFLSPIINGKGYTFKEVQISEERRLDVVLTYLRHKYIIELKRWYGESYHQKGLGQLSDYLDRQGVEEGYLVIFEGAKEKTQRQERIEHQGKRIFAVWV